MYAINSRKGWYSTLGIWLDNPEYADFYADKQSAITARDDVLRDPGLMDGLEEQDVVIDHIAGPPPQEGRFLLTNSYGVYGKSGEWTWEEEDFAIYRFIVHLLHLS